MSYYRNWSLNYSVINNNETSVVLNNSLSASGPATLNGTVYTVEQEARNARCMQVLILCEVGQNNYRFEMCFETHTLRECNLALLNWLTIKPDATDTTWLVNYLNSLHTHFCYRFSPSHEHLQRSALPHVRGVGFSSSCANLRKRQFCCLRTVFGHCRPTSVS